jgi:hypothetical protein
MRGGAMIEELASLFDNDDSGKQQRAAPRRRAG